jgi:xylan 1,4-beta-xylosidase
MFDEINWSYSKRGKQILGFLNTQVRNRAIETPWYVRNHNTLTSGNTLGAPVSGSTNVYIEDEEGNPVYNWETIDKIYDSYVANGFRPIIEFGFMPYDLVPAEYQGSSEFGKRDLGIEPYETGKLKYPPKDFNKWQDLIENLVRHLVERYGEEEVAEWYFEIWNEPDLTNYWRGTFEDFCKMYDYAGAGARRAFPGVKYGGPATTHFAPAYLKKFLEHCVSGRNYVTGETGSQLDFISFHSKGAAFSPRRTYGKPAPVQFPSLRDMAHDI